MTADRRMLLVHAHPDDETIGTGATMARYAAEGVGVTLVTCTRGELGEILVPDLAHLAADRTDGLGTHRVGELGAAMKALGVTDHRFLGEPDVLYRDSGMAYAEDGSVVPVDDVHAEAFALVEVDEAAGHLAEVVREVRPQVVVTYDPDGGYGHPDHIQAHRVTMRAVELAAAADGAAGPAWDVPKVYWIAIPETLMRGLLRRFAEAGETLFEGWDPDGRMPSMVMPDELVTTCVDGSAWVDAKSAAMRAHATQISVDGPLFALSNGIGQPLVGREFYRLVKGEPAGERGEDGRESDLFAGVPG